MPDRRVPVVLCYLQLQQRFKDLQDNIDALAAAPLREAEEKFRKEKDDLISRLTALEAEAAKVRMENRGKARHIEELEAALEVCLGVTSYGGESEIVDDSFSSRVPAGENDGRRRGGPQSACQGSEGVGDCPRVRGGVAEAADAIAARSHHM